MARQAVSLGQYQAKISDDNGITRAKVPSPLLRDMGARAGDYLTFRLNEEGNAVMSMTRSKGRRTATKRGMSKRASSVKRKGRTAS